MWPALRSLVPCMSSAIRYMLLESSLRHRWGWKWHPWLQLGEVPLPQDSQFNYGLGDDKSRPRPACPEGNVSATLHALYAQWLLWRARPGCGRGPPAATSAGRRSSPGAGAGLGTVPSVCATPPAQIPIGPAWGRPESNGPGRQSSEASSCHARNQPKLLGPNRAEGVGADSWGYQLSGGG